MEKSFEGFSAQEVNLDKGPPNLKKRLQAHTDGDFFWKIQEGKGDMPSFRDEIIENEIWQIINYIKSSIEGDLVLANI